jgi:ion channel-forming bestrophin family protein
MKISAVGSIVLLFLLVAGAHGFVNSQSTKTATSSSASSSASSAASTTALSIIPSRHKLRDLEWKKPADDEVTNWLKNYGEVSRFYRRDVFDAGDWVRSRRPSRFWETIKKTFSSGLVRQISMECAALTAWTFALVLYNSHLVPRLKLQVLPILKMDAMPFNMAAASLGLLLTFRTNASYQRWNEARTAWGKIINDSRSLVRMACIWYTSTSTDSLKRLVDAVSSFSRTIMNRTLPWQEDEANFQHYCNAQLNGGHNGDYGRRLLKAKHRPTAALAEISSILLQLSKQSQLNTQPNTQQQHPLYHIELEKLVTELCSALGACERIFTSPVPTFYPRHTTRFLAFWIFLLPLALYQPMGGGFVLVPVMSVLGGFMMGIEELANQMEEPFSILPMEKMCQNSIRNTLLEQLDRSITTAATTDANTSSSVLLPEQHYHPQSEPVNGIESTDIIHDASINGSAGGVDMVFEI